MSKQGLKGYFQYGVEIPWDGSNALPTMMLSDCQVEVSFILGANGRKESGNAGRFNWMMIKSYKVIDDRYKPAEPEPAPAKTWFEAGELPTAGTACEYKFKNPKYSWQPVTVNYISWQNAILTCHLDGDEVHTYGYTAADFRPIKTDKEKAIEFALGKIHNGMNRHAAPYIIEQLYDAGLLRLPDNKKPD